MANTRVGFVGCGGMAENHIKALAEHPEVDLVAFCDLNPERLEYVRNTYGGPQTQTFSDAQEMFQRVELDAAYFVLPPFAHGPEFLAVEAGIPFFVEKPVDLDLKRALEIQAGAKEKGLLTAAGYMNRYRQGVQKVRELLQEDPAILTLGGWIGRTPRGRRQPGAGIGSWWPVKERSGGQFHEQVTHTVDLVNWLVGLPVEVHAYGARGLNRGTAPHYNIEDAMVVNLRFPNNAVANLWSSCSSNGGGGGVSLSVYANETTALFTGWEHSVRILREGGQSEERIPGEPDIFKIESYAFIQAVRTGDRSLVKATYDDGVNAIRVTLAANRSLEVGGPVLVNE
ncbi:MAG: hypothetical protein KatS3mg115_1773 [Candidatus Poribacteria bacterium]|nr:MAG: hypothetical protein KatS3mg115_1773 [Candidatus Poribacteria bacterium]